MQGAGLRHVISGRPSYYKVFVLLNVEPLPGSYVTSPLGHNRIHIRQAPTSEYMLYS